MQIKTSLLFGSEAREKLLAGVRKMSDAVSTTLGPRGRNIAIAHYDPTGNIYSRSVVHDGVTVAKAIELEDEDENMGAQLLKQAAQKQVQDVGDGTTVAVLLARAFLDEINALITAGVNPMELRASLEMYIDKLVTVIEKLATKVTSYEQKKYISTVSAEDPELGEMVAKVIDEVGADGLVAVEESKNSKTTVERQEGMQLDRGYAHQLFITNPERMEATLEKPYILVTDKEVNSLEPLRDLVINSAKQGNKLVIIAPTIGPDAMGALLENKLKGVLASLAVQAPSFGQNQKNSLQDIAIFTGAKYITGDAGHKLEDVKFEDLGRAEYITANKTETIIVGGAGKKDVISKRVAEIKASVGKEDQEFDQEKLKERLAKMTTGVAVIKVGGATEVEMLERLERVKDAVAATKAAITDGIVPGGEVIFLTAREKMPKPKTEIERLVHDLLYKSLAEPFIKLITNGGFNDGQMLERIKTTPAAGNNFGVDVKDGLVKDMVKAGIIDPALVPINALINASSVAVQIATTDVVVNPIIKDDKVSKLPQ
jgi:chaperonin GroEL